jgi:hypothetical protein
MADEVGMILRIYPYSLRCPDPGGVLPTHIAITYTPLGAIFGLVPLPPRVLLGIGAITAAYVMVSEWTKRRFFAQAERSHPGGA